MGALKRALLLLLICGPAGAQVYNFFPPPGLSYDSVTGTISTPNTCATTQILFVSATNLITCNALFTSSVSAGAVTVTLGTAITTNPGTLILYPSQAGSLGVNGYSGSTAVPTIRGPAAANNSLIFAAGNSGLTTPTLKGNGYNSTFVMGQSGDFMFQSAVGNPYFFFLNGDTSASRSGFIMDVINQNNSTGVKSGLEFGISGINATGCPPNNTSTQGSFLPALGTNTCYFIMGGYGRDGVTNYPLCLGMDVMQGVASDQAICLVMLGFDANTLDLNIGQVAPVHAIHITSSGTNQATMILGDVNTGSQTTLTGDVAGGGVFIKNISTGTNADFLCLSATNAVLIQASACTISSERFKENITVFSGDALAELDALKVQSFNLKNTGNRDPNADRLQIGLIAENVAAVEPKCSIYEDDLATPKSYRPECITALLVSATQELHKRSENEIRYLWAFVLAIGLLVLHNAHLHVRLKGRAS